ncbi:MAG: hypothetical protein KatS3mg131_1274 [Candidatus Tectimicrobiota bacterium]|nr:MAG: hypothetical protein KatS3mg131_1274 [Candidatus Tectomicrobia bacterium]
MREWRQGIAVRRAWQRWAWYGVLGVSLSLLVPAVLLAQAQQPAPGAAAPSDDRFLQQFISRTLTPPRESPAAAVSSPAGRPDPAAPPATAPSLTAAALRVVGVLALLLALLGAGAYVLRHLSHRMPGRGRRYPVQVLARIPLAPKACLTLVRVPGKVLLLGLAGTTLSLLGELPEEREAAGESEPFLAALAQQLRQRTPQESEQNGFEGMAAALEQKLRSMQQL